MSIEPVSERGSRYVELDSLRGVAALIVVFSHVLGVLPRLDDYQPSNWFELTLIYSPLHILWAGTEAVTLFFVLSGFVLALPFHGAMHGTYPEYFIRRVCRIYLPYLAAVAFALCARMALSGQDVTGLGGLVKKMWTEPFSAFDGITHALLVVVLPDGQQADPVIWSLTHEMRISLVFPVIMWAVIRFRWYVPVGASLAIAAVGDVAGRVVGAEANARTGAYMVLFVVGALLAKHRGTVIAWCKALGGPGQAFVTAAAAAAFTYPFWVFPGTPELHATLLDLAVVTVGAVGFIVLALGSAPHKRFLLTSPVRYLGRVSYSLYLVHAVVIISMVRMLDGLVPLSVTLLGAVVVSVALAGLAHRYVELPSIALGRRMATRQRAKQETSAAI